MVQPGSDRPRQRPGLVGSPMHFPVADHEGTAGFSPRESASTPGSRSPARNASVAPPPVERCPMRPSAPAARIAASESPPPTTVRAPRSCARATAPAIATVPRAKHGFFEQPERAVPDDGPRPGDHVGPPPHGRAPDVEAHPRPGSVLADRELVGPLGGSRRGDAVVLGEHQPVSGRGEQIPRPRNQFRLQARVADGEAPRGEERVLHRASHQHSVGAAQQRVQNRELVRDLGAAEDRDERARRIVEQAAERGEFAPQQRAGRRPREESGAGVHRGVRPVRGPEGVQRVLVGEPAQPPGEARIVRRLAPVEAQVLEKQDFAGAQRRRQLGGAGAARVRREPRPETLGDREQAEIQDPRPSVARDATRGRPRPRRPAPPAGPARRLGCGCRRRCAPHPAGR